MKSTVQRIQENERRNGRARANGNPNAGAGNACKTPLPPKAGFPEPIDAPDLKARTDDARFLWHGYMPFDGITLLSAMPKAGKTTFIANLLRMLPAGGALCGKQLNPGRALVVTEEAESLWASRRDKLGLTVDVSFIIRPFRTKPRPMDWLAFLVYLGDVLAKRPPDLLVLDTLSRLWPVKDENDASQVEEALLPLTKLAEGRALLAVSHIRKSDGTEGTATRGSGAIVGAVDAVIEMRRLKPKDASDRRRVLTGFGRYQIPDELVIELDADGLNYTARGDRREATARDIVETVAELLPDGPPGMTPGEVKENWSEESPVGINALREVLRDKAGDRWMQTGTGASRDPFRYWLPK